MDNATQQRIELVPHPLTAQEQRLAQAVHTYVAALAVLKDGTYGSDVSAAITKRILTLLDAT